MIQNPERIMTKTKNYQYLNFYMKNSIRKANRKMTKIFASFITKV
jgi:hypothetical protein